MLDADIRTRHSKGALGAGPEPQAFSGALTYVSRLPARN
jgi:hypothetical protein